MEKTTVLLIILSLSFTWALAGFASSENDDDYGTYKFDYGVEDLHTGDVKSHHEVRLGKEVSGVYTVREPDGTVRVVKYTAGPHKGFQAEVHKVKPSDFGSTSGTSDSRFGGFSGQGLGLLGQNSLQGGASEQATVVLVPIGPNQNNNY
ncbi:cuticle protein 7-like [Tribolium madens]|uniref:cuticle protein 7-like n=1 Tax=Tribolium madens TaxID=41895 RepID=UPI001CF74DEF|nr:cuticle protein 7-like [Tribolium madens]